MGGRPARTQADETTAHSGRQDTQRKKIASGTSHRAPALRRRLCVLFFFFSFFFLDYRPAIQCRS